MGRPGVSEGRLLMGQTHRVTGLCAGAYVAWAVRSAVLDPAAPLPVTVLAVACCAAVCVWAGWAAYWPDLDSARSTASTSFGLISALAHDFVHGLSCAVWDLSATEADRKAGDFRGHRGLTHFAITAVFAGALVGAVFWAVLAFAPVVGIAVLAGVFLGALAGWLWSDRMGTFVGIGSGLVVSTMTKANPVLVLAGVVGFATFLALTKLFRPWVKRRNAPVFGLTFGVLAGLALVVLLRGVFGAADQPVVWSAVSAVLAVPLGIGIAVASALGMVAHSLGDGKTVTGAPLLWPLKIKGRRYYPVFISFPENRHKTGSDGGNGREWRIRAWCRAALLVAVIGWFPGGWGWLGTLPWPWV